LTETVTQSDSLDLVAAQPSLEDLVPTDLSKAKVVILDLHLPGMEGPDAVRCVRTAGPAALVLSASDEPSKVIDAIGAGAAGYLTKGADTDEIVQAIRIVSSGGTYVSPVLAGHLLHQAWRKERAAQLDLTPREREVLELVADGETDADIADRLYISVHTVHSHLDRIREKTGRRRRPELTRYAIEHDIKRQYGLRQTGSVGLNAVIYRRRAPNERLLDGRPSWPGPAS
jgi:DNA-binding NarL/FixJ family response regulator